MKRRLPRRVKSVEGQTGSVEVNDVMKVFVYVMCVRKQELVAPGRLHNELLKYQPIKSISLSASRVLTYVENLLKHSLTPWTPKCVGYVLGVAISNPLGTCRGHKKPPLYRLVGQFASHHFATTCLIGCSASEAWRFIPTWVGLKTLDTAVCCQ